MKDLDKNISKAKNGFYLLDVKGSVWNDATRYDNRNKRGKTSPTSWELDLDFLRIFITKQHIYYKGTWIMFCHQLRLIEVKCVNCNTATEAAEYAVNLVNKKLGEMTNAIKNLQKR